MGKTNVNINARRSNKRWYTPDNKKLAKEKINSYLQYLSRRDEYRQRYATTRNRVNAQIRLIKKDHRNRFTKDMKNHLYGAQRKVWVMLRRRKQKINEYMETQTIQAVTQIK